MSLIVGTIRLPPESVAGARAAMARMFATTRAEPGCLEYSYAEDILASGLIHVCERWSDLDALGRHFASNHIASLRTQWREIGIAGRELTAFDVGTGRPV